MSTQLPVRFIKTVNPSAVFVNSTEGLTPDSVDTKTISYVVKYFLTGIYVSVSGEAKVEIRIGTPTLEAVKRIFYTTKADQNVGWILQEPMEIPIDRDVVIEVTNKDIANVDLSSTVQGYQIA